jgi:hypothetical protein
MAATKRKLTALDINAILKKLDDYLVSLQKQWDAQPHSPSSWWRLNRVRFSQGVQFLIECLDKLVLFVEDLIPAGTDKKAAVISLLDKLFDYVVTPCLPIWLKPFAPIIKDIVINFVISSIIDLIVSKYNKGIWKKDVTYAKTKTYYLPRR